MCLCVFGTGVWLSACLCQNQLRKVKHRGRLREIEVRVSKTITASAKAARVRGQCEFV